MPNQNKRWETKRMEAKITFENGQYVTRLWEDGELKYTDRCLIHNSAVDFASSRGAEIVETCGLEGREQ